ncbi:hypothetical protein NEFER01_1674 [Nematocida sp. LUAm1]|nr:hypothetical protein NEFER02_1519 [Nematocida sp. LUAm2]KAI5178538.1 hypothetical protein NEFER01_1674 [Nematocida sp. LUAm1]
MLTRKRAFISQDKQKTLNESNWFLSEYYLYEILDWQFFFRRTILGYFLLHLFHEYSGLLLLFISFSFFLWSIFICQIENNPLFSPDRSFLFIGGRKFLLLQILSFPSFSLFLSFFYCRYRKPTYSIRKSFFIWSAFLTLSSSYLFVLSYLNALTPSHLFVQSVILSSFLLYSLNFSSSSPLHITYIFSSAYLLYLMLVLAEKQLYFYITSITHSLQ